MSGSPNVLVVDRTGQGGVHQYSHGLAAAMSESGGSATLLTTTLRESVPPAGDRYRTLQWLRWGAVGSGRYSELVREVVNFAMVVVVAFATRSKVVLIQLVHPAMTDQWTVPILRVLGRRVVLTCHNLGMHERGRIDAHGLRAYRRADAIVTLSEAERAKLLAEAPEIADRAAVVPHGNFRYLVRERPDQRTARLDLGLSPDGITLLFFGYFRRYKGIDVLLDAVAVLRDQGTPVTVVLAGASDDAMTAEVTAQVDELGLGDQVVVRAGYVPVGDIDRYFAAADVVVLPYRSATQSGVIQLSYAHGRPVVVTDVGGLAEDVVAGETGEIAQPEDPDSLAAAIGRVLADPAALSRCQSRLIAAPPRRHEWDGIAAAYRDVAAGTGATVAEGRDDPVLVFVSDVHWDGYWYGAQHLASRLAERGFRVLFLELPVSLASPLRDRSRLRQLRRRMKRISSTLAVDIPLGVPPQDNPRMRGLNAAIFARRIRRVLRRLGWPEPAVLVARHQYAGRLAPHFPKAVFVANLSDASWWGEDAETALRLAAADAAVCVSPGLADEARLAGVDDVLFLPQGVDAEGVAGSAGSGPAPIVAAVPSPRIGMIGHFTPRLDLDLVDEIARARPDWHFVFVGDTMRFFPELMDLPMSSYPNVHQLPPCDRHDVGSHVAAFDVAWIPYAWSEFNVASNPLKAWEYLAAGAPVVAPAFPALDPMREVATLMAEGAGAAEWIRAVEDALASDDPGAAEVRQKFARSNSWDVRADELAGFLHDLRARGGP